MIKNIHIPYTVFEVKRYEMMKGYVDAFHTARDTEDFEAYRNALADLADLFATTREQKRGYEIWKGMARLLRACKSWAADDAYLSQSAATLEDMVGNYGERIDISFKRWITGSDKLDAAVGLGPMQTIFNVGRDDIGV